MLSLLDSVTTETVSPVYLMHGPERYLIEQVVAKLKKIVTSGPMADFNLVSIKASDVSGAEIVARSQEIPMMATKRLLIVEDAHKLKAADFEVLDSYFADPAPETCLVIIGDRFDLRRKAFVRANKLGQIHLAEPLKEQKIIPFLRSRAKVRGAAISEGALRAISQAVGPDCAALDDAVERLALYAGSGREVSEEDVAEVVTAVREHSVFELVDAIGNKNSLGAISLLESLISHREEPLKINAMVARHVRQLLNTRIHLHLGTDTRDLAGLLGVPPFIVNKLTNQARRFRGTVLEQFLVRLARADFELKSSRRPAKLIIENAILDLCLGGV